MPLGSKFACFYSPSAHVLSSSASQPIRGGWAEAENTKTKQVLVT
jgi:hypothetical protein